MNSKGFTLFELLIVVTIIGVLAMIAVPAYQDYSVRSRVSEAASLSGPAKTAIDIAHSEGYALGDIPSQSSLGLSNPGSYNSKYVTSVTTTDSGRIIVQLSNDKSLSSAAGRVLTYVPADGGKTLIWTASCDFATKYCPKN